MPVPYRKSVTSLNVLFLIIILSLLGCGSGTTKSNSNSTSDTSTRIHRLLYTGRFGVIL